MQASRLEARCVEGTVAGLQVAGVFLSLPTGLGSSFFFGRWLLCQLVRAHELPLSHTQGIPPPRWEHLMVPRTEAVSAQRMAAVRLGSIFAPWEEKLDPPKGRIHTK